MTNSPNLTTVPLPPAKGRSIGRNCVDWVLEPPRQNWGKFKAHKWGGFTGRLEVATVMAQARQYLGVALAGKDRADDPQAGRAGDVGDDVMQLKIHFGQRVLHMLDM